MIPDNLAADCYLPLDSVERDREFIEHVAASEENGNVVGLSPRDSRAKANRTDFQGYLLQQITSSPRRSRLASRHAMSPF